MVVIEYEVHGTILATGVRYNNRFCSIINIEYKKISHSRDYQDSLATWNALTAKARGAALVDKPPRHRLPVKALEKVKGARGGRSQRHGRGAETEF